MKIPAKLLFLLPFIFLFISCSSKDDEVPFCSLFPLSGELYIEFIDTEGNNLFQTGYYDPLEVVVTVNGSVIGGVRTFNGTAFYVIPQSGAESRNGAEYKVSLSPTETDNMKIFYSIEDSCSRNGYTVQRVTYNGEERGILYFEGNQKINVMKNLLTQ